MHWLHRACNNEDQTDKKVPYALPLVLRINDAFHFVLTLLHQVILNVTLNRFMVFTNGNYIFLMYYICRDLGLKDQLVDRHVLDGIKHSVCWFLLLFGLYYLIISITTILIYLICCYLWSFNLPFNMWFSNQKPAILRIVAMNIHLFIWLCDRRLKIHWNSLHRTQCQLTFLVLNGNLIKTGNRLLAAVFAMHIFLVIFVHLLEIKFILII